MVIILYFCNKIKKQNGKWSSNPLKQKNKIISGININSGYYFKEAEFGNMLKRAAAIGL
jgi:hypothetical protein